MKNKLSRIFSHLIRLTAVLRLVLAFCVVILLFFAVGHVYYALTGDFREVKLLGVASGVGSRVASGIGIGVESGIEGEARSLTQGANEIKSGSPERGGLKSESLERGGLEKRGDGPLLTGKIFDLLQQPFTFLGHGHQTYAFLSADGRFVLKVFKDGALKRSWYYKAVPPIYPLSEWMIFTGDEAQHRRDRLIEGYSIGYHELRDHTGLIYFHSKIGDFSEGVSLVSSKDSVDSDNSLLVTFVDGIGCQHVIDLSKYVFAIQEKVIPTRDVLNDLLGKGDVEGAKLALARIFAMYRAEFSRGFFDHDRNFIDNTGFIGDRPIRHDVGRLKANSAMMDRVIGEQELKKVVSIRLSPWLKLHWPMYHDEIMGGLGV